MLVTIYKYYEIEEYLICLWFICKLKSHGFFVLGIDKHSE